MGSSLIYQLRVSAVPQAELRRYWTGLPGLAISVARLFRLHWPRVRVEYPPAIRALEVPDESSALRAMMQPDLAVLISNGQQLRYEFVASSPDVDMYGAVTISADGTVVANLSAARSKAGPKSVALSLSSESTQGAKFITSSNRPLLADPPEFDALHLPGAPAEEVLRVHSERVPKDLRSLAAEDLLLRQKLSASRWIEFQRDRGAIVLAT